MPLDLACGHRFGAALVADREHRAPGLVRSRALEERYARDLRKIARQIGEIVRAWTGEGEDIDLSRIPGLETALARYAEAIRPWAGATAQRMVAEAAIKERRAWADQAKRMSRALRQELEHAPTGEVFRRIVAEQVREITSLPTEAARRVYDLSVRGLETGARASEIAREIMRAGEVSASRATMLARTAVGSTSSALTEARASHIGSTGYIWRTARDSDVRPSHARMEGRFVAWTAPPTLDGYTAHAGRFANCRCYPEPVIPEV